MTWPETFWAEIEKGVCDIAGELRKLNISEKRQLLAILREHEDYPVKWKNKDPKKQHNILHRALQIPSDLLFKVRIVFLKPFGHHHFWINQL